MNSGFNWKLKIYSRIKAYIRNLDRMIELHLSEDDSRYRDNIIGSNVYLGDSNLLGNCAIDNNVYLKGHVTIGMYSTIGRECLIYGGKIQIGNYCQLGPRIAIYGINHPLNHITTYVNKNLFYGQLKSFAQSDPVEIGNDVWIGYGSILLPGIKVGNGAIIGAGAVVTKDVGSYEVAVGNPAKVIKARYELDIIELLNLWKWWNLDPEELNQYQRLFTMNTSENPEEFRNYLKTILSYDLSG